MLVVGSAMAADTPKPPYHPMIEAIGKLTLPPPSRPPEPGTRIYAAPGAFDIFGGTAMTIVSGHPVYFGFPPRRPAAR